MFIEGTIMKKKIHNLFSGLTIFSFILMIVVDFFPEAINIQLRTILFILILVGIIAALTKDKAIIKSNPIISKVPTLSFGTSLILLLVILTLMGGQSESGIGINNPIIWLLYFASVISVLFKKKRNINDNL